jgi:hypothetical protein
MNRTIASFVIKMDWSSCKAVLVKSNFFPSFVIFLHGNGHCFLRTFLFLERVDLSFFFFLGLWEAYLGTVFIWFRGFGLIYLKT